jgi:acetyl esterase/lipase
MQTPIRRRTALASSVAAALSAATARAATARAATARAATAPAADGPGRQVPARFLPVPDTVSPALQARIAAPYPPTWNQIPQSAAAWKDAAAQSAVAVAPHLPALIAAMRVRVESATMAGVPVSVVTPDDMPARNRDRVLMHLHGGGYVYFPGEAGAGEAMLLAGYGRLRIISVDYRMPPDHPFPAALDDAVAVWRDILRTADPRRTAIFGTSAGGGLTLATVLRLRALSLPLPAAIGPGTPWVDLTSDGDSIAANAFVDNVLVSYSGWVGAAARLYAGGRDLRDPLISPINGDLSGFPPAILTSGTRDLLLSDTVRTHRKLRRAGVEAVLQVFEGQSHAQYLTPGVPETQEALTEIAAFFDRHLAV